MPTLSMPTSPGFRSWRFRLIGNTQTFVSPLNRTVQTLELAGAQWALEAALPPMKRVAAIEWTAFLAQLRGAAGRFYAGDPGGETARGAATGTPLVNGASQTGASLITDGWTASVTNILRKGDYIAFDTSAGRELHMVVADVNSNGSGQATLTIEPPIRTSPANNATIIVSSPTCIMRLADDEQGAWSVDAFQVYGFQFNAVEAFV